MSRFPLGLLLRSKWFVFLLVALATLVWLAVRELIGIGGGDYPTIAALLWLFFLGLTCYLIVHHLANFHPVANVMGDEAMHRADYENRRLEEEERRLGDRSRSDNDRWM